ncbi:MAG: NAD(P)H-dependent flavin oxidoreductase, partial [Candidatus Thorarchaeota archaeon]
SDYIKKRDPVKIMKENMLKVIEHTDKPFGFNVRTSRREIEASRLVTEIPKFIMSNPKLRDQVLYAITSAGSSKTLPESKAYQELKKSGSNIKHFHVAPALWLADKCVASKVDGLVVTGGEGGGHQSYEKVSTLVLLQQVLQKHPSIPVIACGGFASGEGLAAALSMGAGAIAMGSRFIASVESEFHQTYKDVVPEAEAQDTVLVTGALGPIRLWKNEYSLHHGLVADKEQKMEEEAKFTAEDIIAEGKAYEAAYTGDINSGAVLLGQSIGIIESVKSVKTIIEEIVESAEKRIKNASSLIK